MLGPSKHEKARGYIILQKVLWQKKTRLFFWSTPPDKGQNSPRIIDEKSEVPFSVSLLCPHSSLNFKLFSSFSSLSGFVFYICDNEGSVHATVIISLAYLSPLYTFELSNRSSFPYIHHLCRIYLNY